MRNLGWLSVALLLAFALPSVAEKVTTMPAPTGYIDDYANVLTPPAKSELEDLCNDLHTKTKAQIFVVTINSLEGESVETFANHLFAKWKIGEKKTDRGVLILLAIKDHKRWIEIGTGFEGILNDAKVGDIGREMVPALKAADYDEAARTGVRRVAQIIAADSNVTLDIVTSPESLAAMEKEYAPPPVVKQQPLIKSKGLGIAAVVLFFFGVLGGIIFLFRRLSKFSMNRVGTPGSGRSSSSGSGGSSSFDDDFFSNNDSFGGGGGGGSDGGGAGGDW
jgi:uncharacterized protein